MMSAECPMQITQCDKRLLFPLPPHLTRLQQFTCFFLCRICIPSQENPLSLTEHINFTLPSISSNTIGFHNPQQLTHITLWLSWIYTLKGKVMASFIISLWQALQQGQTRLRTFFAMGRTNLEIHIQRGWINLTSVFPMDQLSIVAALRHRLLLCLHKCSISVDYTALLYLQHYIQSFLLWEIAKGDRKWRAQCKSSPEPLERYTWWSCI